LYRGEEIKIKASISCPGCFCFLLFKDYLVIILCCLGTEQSLTDSNLGGRGSQAGRIVQFLRRRAMSKYEFDVDEMRLLAHSMVNLPAESSFDL